LQVVKIQTTQFIAASPNPGFDPENTTGTMGARGAGFSADDDDWED
jgi:hypothetical protein